MRYSMTCRNLLLPVILLLTADVYAGFEIRSARVAGHSYVVLPDVAAYYGMQYASSGESARLSSRYSQLSFTRHRREAMLNDVAVHLSHAPTRWKGNLMLSSADFRLLLDPILRREAVSARTVRKIVLDPGHGGRDPGTRGARALEKDLTLEFARRAARRLKTAGFDVRLTRTSDSGLSLSQRVRQARWWSADLFVSLHTNYVGSSSVRGIETFLVSPQGTPSTYGNKLRTHASKGNRHDHANARLAYEIQKNLIQQTGAEDRGIKHANFQVLRDAPCPAVLVETGFLSNRREEMKLVNPDYQERLASGIAYGILAFKRAVQRR